MANHPNRAKATQWVVGGIWLDDGYQRTAGPRGCEITRIGQTLYDTELLRMAGAEAARLTIDSDGALSGWGDGVTFSPYAGELARIGIT